MILNLRNSFLLCCFVAVTALTLTSCQKDGDTGPAGPAGSANVQYSPWFTPSPWVVNTLFGLKHISFAQPAAAITQTIIDSGQVIVYGKVEGYVASLWPTGRISALPIVLNYLSGTTLETDTWSAMLTPGTVTIDFVNNNNLYTSLAAGHQFRYIVIPGGVSTGRVNYASLPYEEVCSRLNIQP